MLQTLKRRKRQSLKRNLSIKKVAKLIILASISHLISMRLKKKAAWQQPLEKAKNDQTLMAARRKRNQKKNQFKLTLQNKVMINSLVYLAWLVSRVLVQIEVISGTSAVSEII